jgi:hypothetical protein
MAQMLAGLGWRFTILEPAALRDEVSDLAGRLASDAGADPSTPAHALPESSGKI